MGIPAGPGFSGFAIRSSATRTDALHIPFPFALRATIGQALWKPIQCSWRRSDFVSLRSTAHSPYWPVPGQLVYDDSLRPSMLAFASRCVIHFPFVHADRLATSKRIAGLKSGLAGRGSGYGGRFLTGWRRVFILAGRPCWFRSLRALPSSHGSDNWQAPRVKYFILGCKIMLQ